MGRKIVLNQCYGGFSLSERVRGLYEERAASGEKKGSYFDQDVRRDDPILIQIIEDTGLSAAAGEYSKLSIVEIPDDVPADGWTIMEYDGIEWVAEKHRTWSAGWREME
jgi:hypothetical protein